MSESTLRRDDRGEYLRQECAGLLEALAYLLGVAALRAGKSRSAFLFDEVPGGSVWYQHQKGRKRISVGKYLQYREVLCATDAERDALDQHWLVYQRACRPARQGRELPVMNDEESSSAAKSLTSQGIDTASALAEESTTLRLARVKLREAPPTAEIRGWEVRSDEPRDTINALVKVGDGCNGQTAAAVSFFVANQQRFQRAGGALAHVGFTGCEEVTLAQSVSCLLRFGMTSLSGGDLQFWSDFLQGLERRLGGAGDWLYRVRHEMPAYSTIDPSILRFQHQRAHHFVKALQARAPRPIAVPDQTEEFLSLGSCVLAAYSYLLRSQLVALTATGEHFSLQVDQGEKIIQAIRRLGDNDVTRRLLGATATDSERVFTSLSTVYRSMANLQLMSVWSAAGRRDRQTDLRHARTNIRTAYDLLLADKPTWLHGVANTFVSGAAYRYCVGDVAGARGYLGRAAEYYRCTADGFRAAVCDRGCIEMSADPGSIDWIRLIFVE
jgi:hypothetical protein